LGADRRVGANARAPISDHAIDRRAQFGVAEVQLREIAFGDGCCQRRLGLLLLRIDDIKFALRCRERRACLRCGGDGLLAIGVGLLETLHRGVLV